jgi:hypothetical protein
MWPARARKERDEQSSTRKAAGLAAMAALLALAVQAALGSGSSSVSSAGPLPTVCIGATSAAGCLGENTLPPGNGSAPPGSTPGGSSTTVLPGTTVVTTTTRTTTATTTQPSNSNPPPPTTGSNPPPGPPPLPPPKPDRRPLIRNDGNRALFLLPNAKPGSASTTCVTVTYTGKKKVSIRLYGAGGGTGLGGFVDLKITRGTSTSKKSLSCKRFTPDTMNYLGAGAGVIFVGTLATFPTTYASTVDDPSGAAEVWTKNEAHAYRVRVRVRDDNAAQGLWAYQAFTWEARKVP